MPKPLVWFTLICVIAVLWNVAGLMAVISDLRLSAADIARMTPAQQALYATRPFWSVAASLLAVGAGTIGSIGLMLRRRWSTVILVASVVGVVMQDVSLFLMTQGSESSNSVAVILQIVVLVVACALVGLATQANHRGWLR
jgi:hypothetical protein